MDYDDYYKETDLLIKKLDSHIKNLNNNDQMRVIFSGLVAVLTVGVFEDTIKEILIDFAGKQNKMLGIVSKKHFGKIHDKIKIDDLKGKHVGFFGDDCKEKFKKALEKFNEKGRIKERKELIALYINLIEARHIFVHNHTNFQSGHYEIKDGYKAGKTVIGCLYDFFQKYN